MYDDHAAPVLTALLEPFHRTLYYVDSVSVPPYNNISFCWPPSPLVSLPSPLRCLHQAWKRCLTMFKMKSTTLREGPPLWAMSVELQIQSFYKLVQHRMNSILLCGSNMWTAPSRGLLLDFFNLREPLFEALIVKLAVWSPPLQVPVPESGSSRGRSCGSASSRRAPPCRPPSTSSPPSSHSSTCSNDWEERGRRHQTSTEVSNF